MTRYTHSLANALPSTCAPSRNSFLDSTEALNTSKQYARTTLWVEEWNVPCEPSTEWRDRGIIPNEHFASGTNEPWSTWRSLNRLRVQKGRCLAMMKMWKLSHTYVIITIIIIIIIIIQLYFRPQWVHRKDNTQYAVHVNITQITKYALNMSAYHSSVRLYNVAIHLLFSFDATCTSLLIALCVIKLKETSSLQPRLYVI